MERLTKHIAVFGDVHGHLRLMFQLCRLWQIKHSVHLDCILQCGDLGFFPELTNVDKATKRYAKRDPEELDFAKYFRRPVPPERDELLDSMLNSSNMDLDTIRCPVIWCHGNHEDFKELEKTVGDETLAPVDAFGKLKLLRSGHLAEIAGVRIAAIGGGTETGKHGDFGDRWKYIDDKACQNLLEGFETRGEVFDVLITHVSPKSIGGFDKAGGSELLYTIDDHCQPTYHFYAHHTESIPPSRIRKTQCYWLNDVKFKRLDKGMLPYGALENGCMGILSWAGPHDNRYEVLQEDWQNDITWSNWHKY